MHNRHTLLVTIVILALPSLSIANPLGLALYGVEEDDSGVQQIDKFTGAEEQQCAISGGGADGVTAMTADPSTGMFYLAVETTGSATPKLITLNLRTCEQTDIGNLGDDVTGLAVDNFGTLYAVTSDSATTNDTLFTVNTANAVMTYYMDLPRPDGFGDTIAFNTGDGLLYHMTGIQGNGNVAFNAITPGTMNVRAIALSGNRPAGTEVLSFTWSSANNYFVGFRGGFPASPEFFSVDAFGNQAKLSDATGRFMSGMAIYDTDVLPDPAPVGSGRNLYAADSFGPYITQVDPLTGAELGLQSVYLPGETIFGFNGLAYDSTTSEMYAVARLAPGLVSRSIIKLNPSTGDSELIGDTGERIAAIAFDDAGTLYASSTENAIDQNNPETLYTVNKSDGSLTVFTAMGGGEFGEALAFDSNDGKMYRASGPTNLDSIDLAGPSISQVLYSGDINVTDTILALTYDASADIFLGHRRTVGPSQFFSLTSGGLVTDIDTQDVSKKGFAFVPATPIFSNDITTFADVTGDMTPDVASLEGDQSVQPSVNVYSGESGDIYSTNNFLNNNWRGAGLATVRDGNQDGTADDPAAAVLAVNNDSGSIRVQTRRIDTNALLSSTLFLNEKWRAIDVVVVDDLNGDGVTNDTAIAVLAERKSDGRVQLQLRNFANGALISNTVYLNARWIPIAAAVADRGAMAPVGTLPPLIGVIAHNGENNRRSMQSRVAGSGAFDQNIKFLGSTWNYNDVSVNHDANGDGVLDDPIWLVLATRISDDVIRVQSRFVGNGAFQDNVVILNSNWQAFRLDVAMDISGNTAQEMAVTAIRRADGVRRIHIKDYATGSTTTNIAP